MQSLRTFKAVDGKYFVITAGVNYRRADCFSSGFNTRKEATKFKHLLLERQKGTKLTLWEAHQLPEFYPENGSSKEIPEYLLTDNLREELKK
jgi:hypothetical protein